LFSGIPIKKEEKSYACKTERVIKIKTNGRKKVTQTKEDHKNH